MKDITFSEFNEYIRENSDGDYNLLNYSLKNPVEFNYRIFLI